jgi:hypothetical protein
MVRRDELTYDLGPARRPTVSWKPALLLATVLAVAGLLLVWSVVSSRTPQTAPAISETATVSPTPSQSGWTARPLPSGSDAAEGQGIPEGSQQAASVFVRAWLNRDAKARKPALQEVTAPALAEQLMLTDPENIPRARPRGAPVLDDASTYSTQFTQALSTGMRIQVYLVADPGSRYGWLATSVDQA